MSTQERADERQAAGENQVSHGDETALDAEGLEQAWGRSLQAFACSSCQHSFVAPAEVHIQGRCAWCGETGGLSRSRAQLRAEPPELLVPFSFDRSDVDRLLGGEVSKVPKWVRPVDLQPRRLGERLKATYYPMWLVDSQVKATWQCDAGFDYDVKTHRERQVDNKWQTQEVRRTHIDWEPRAGTFARKIDNVPAPALSEHGSLERALGTFREKGETPYEPECLRAAVAILPNLSPEETWREARTGLVEVMSTLIQEACQAQHLEKLELEDEHGEQVWTLKLLPVWTTWYAGDDGKTHIFARPGAEWPSVRKHGGVE